MAENEQVGDDPYRSPKPVEELPPPRRIGPMTVFGIAVVSVVAGVVAFCSTCFVVLVGGGSILDGSNDPVTIILIVSGAGALLGAVFTYRKFMAIARRKEE